MSRLRLLDLFCGAGGAAMGYHRAGFDVVGVDWKQQNHYPYEFVRADAIAILSRLAADEEPWPGAPWFDTVHVSPPCQDHSSLAVIHESHNTGWMLPASRFYLQQQARPWVIENVPGAPMRADYKLCGCLFDLPRLRRERWFETSWQGFEMRPPCHHVGSAVTVCGHGAQGSYEYVDGVAPTQADRRRAMGIDWMNRDELAQAIPPAFAQHIGAQLLEHLQAAA